jgi:virulence-associated protein VagC
MDLFLDNGRQLVLATNRIAGSIAVLDPETTMVTPILTDFPTDRIHLFDQGRSALLYAMGEEMAYFATLENIVEEKEMNLEEFSFGGPLSAFIPVPGRDFAAFMLSGEAQRIFFIDFLTREMHQVYLSGSAGSAQFLIYPDGSRMIINPVNQKEIWFISDMTSYEVDPIIVDELVGRMWLLESSGKIILDHKYAEGYYTFIDADSPQRSTARSLWGFLFEDAASIDPDDYPMSKQP